MGVGLLWLVQPKDKKGQALCGFGPVLRAG